jgi:hypothetical protein
MKTANRVDHMSLTPEHKLSKYLLFQVGNTEDLFSWLLVALTIQVLLGFTMT